MFKASSPELSATVFGYATGYMYGYDAGPQGKLGRAWRAKTETPTEKEYATKIEAEPAQQDSEAPWASWPDGAKRQVFPLSVATCRASSNVDSGGASSSSIAVVGSAIVPAPVAAAAAVAAPVARPPVLRRPAAAPRFVGNAIWTGRHAGVTFVRLAWRKDRGPVLLSLQIEKEKKLVQVCSIAPGKCRFMGGLAGDVEATSIELMEELAHEYIADRVADDRLYDRRI